MWSLVVFCSFKMAMMMMMMMMMAVLVFLQVQRALVTVDVDVAKLNCADDADDVKLTSAKRYLRATNWMFEARLAGSEIIDRYEQVTTMQPEWEQGYFSLGRCYDTQLKALPKVTTS